MSLTRCLQFTNFEYCSCGLDCTWSFAWKDRRALDALSPFILRHIDAFGTHELALILNAHKRLEYDTGQGDKGSHAGFQLFCVALHQTPPATGRANELCCFAFLGLDPVGHSATFRREPIAFTCWSASSVSRRRNGRGKFLH